MCLVTALCLLNAVGENEIGLDRGFVKTRLVFVK